ncbi:MAG: RNA polymerase sigma factor [Acidobacteriota bacterium]
MGPNDKVLIERCHTGDPQAWEALVEKYSKRIFNLVFQFTSNIEDSEDLTQEIFLKVFNGLRRFNIDTPFLPWLIRVAKNFCIDNYRERSRNKMIKDDGSIIDRQRDYTYHPFNSLLEKERAGIIMKGIQSLSEEMRTVIILRDIQGFNYAEIAASLQVPEGTVKSRINRGRIELAGILKKTKKLKGIL